MFTLQILIIGIIIIITRPRPAFGRLGLGGLSCKKLLTGQLLMPRFADEIWIIKNFWQLLHSEPKRDITRWEESSNIIYFHSNQTVGHFFLSQIDRQTDTPSWYIHLLIIIGITIIVRSQIQGQWSVWRAWKALPNKVGALVELFQSPARNRTQVPLVGSHPL